MTEGFILLHRKIENNWLWKRSDYLHWFLHFLFLANFKDNDKYLFEGKFITVKRGQFVTSYRLLAKSLPKCSEQKIRTFIQLLIKDNIILIKSLQKATQITICNYDSYQGEQHNSNTVATQQQHSSNTVATTIERKKKKKKQLNNKDIPIISFDIFWNNYDYKTGKKSKVEQKWNNLSDNERRLIIEYIPKYIKSTPDKKYRKYPETFLNNEGWTDEILVHKTNGQYNKNEIKPPELKLL